MTLEVAIEAALETMNLEVVNQEEVTTEVDSEEEAEGIIMTIEKHLLEENHKMKDSKKDKILK